LERLPSTRAPLRHHLGEIVQGLLQRQAARPPPGLEHVKRSAREAASDGGQTFIVIGDLSDRARHEFEHAVSHPSVFLSWAQWRALPTRDAKKALVGWGTSKLCRGLWVALPNEPHPAVRATIGAIWELVCAGCPVVLTGDAALDAWHGPVIASLCDLTSLRSAVGPTCHWDQRGHNPTRILAWYAGDPEALVDVRCDHHVKAGRAAPVSPEMTRRIGCLLSVAASRLEKHQMSRYL
jgi:hypothetical protein